jgi:eukaryotic-like serine/threonine-protein kinase
MPVSGISLDDVEAYTGWLDRTGRVKGARPCTEHEWERAARGADDREYPHGDRMTPREANFDETYGKQPRAMGPDEVGSFPASRSPFGLDDLSGNVGELTVGTISGEAASMRGGAFYWGSLTGRATNRWTVERTSRSVMVGLRVCANP